MLHTANPDLPEGPADGVALAPDRPLVCDPTRKWVRVTGRRADGLVAFEFSIGWPDLTVELLLPASAFDEFCQRNAVQRLDA